MDKLNFLKSLNKSGVTFVVSYPSAGGSASFVASAEDLIKISENPDGVIAAHCGVSIRDYILWKEEGFSVQCADTTKKGSRCRNIVTGGSMVEPRKWSELTGRYCDKHENGAQSKR